MDFLKKWEVLRLKIIEVDRPVFAQKTSHFGFLGRLYFRTIYCAPPKYRPLSYFRAIYLLEDLEFDFDRRISAFSLS